MTGLPRQAAGASLSHSRAQVVRWARGGPARSPAPLCGTEGAPMRHRPFLWTDHFHENCVQISEQMPSGINLTHKRKVPHAVSPTEPLGWSTEHPAWQTAHATVLGLLLLLWAPRQKAQPARHTATALPAAAKPTETAALRSEGRAAGVLCWGTPLKWLWQRF